MRDFLSKIFTENTPVGSVHTIDRRNTPIEVGVDIHDCGQGWNTRAGQVNWNNEILLQVVSLFHFMEYVKDQLHR